MMRDPASVLGWTYRGKAVPHMAQSAAFALGLAGDQSMTGYALGGSRRIMGPVYKNDVYEGFPLMAGPSPFRIPHLHWVWFLSLLRI